MYRELSLTVGEQTIKIKMPKPKDPPLSDDKMEVFFSLVQQNNCLYDKTDVNYRDLDIHKNIWSSIQEAMGVMEMTGEAWKTKWRSSKDTFTRKKREWEASKRSGAGRESIKDPNKWKWWKYLQFLTPYVEDAETESNMGEAESLRESDHWSADTDDDEIQSMKENQATASNRNSPPVSKKRIYPRVKSHNESDGTAAIFQRILNRSEESKKERNLMLQQIVNKPQSPDELLFQSYGKSMELFSEAEKMEIRMRVAQIFYDVQKSRHMEQTASNNTASNFYSWPTYTNL